MSATEQGLALKRGARKAEGGKRKLTVAIDLSADPMTAGTFPLFYNQVGSMCDGRIKVGISVNFACAYFWVGKKRYDVSLVEFFQAMAQQLDADAAKHPQEERGEK